MRWFLAAELFAYRLRVPMLCVVATLSCSRGDGRVDSSVPQIAAVRDTTTPRPGVRFNPETIKSATPVGTLLLDSISAQLAAVDSVWVGTAWFKGELMLNGRTLRHFEPDARVVCFEADSASAARMPRWSGDERRAWFCFENVDHAVRLLGPPSVERDASVVIDRFVIHRGLSDQVNSARLLRVTK